MCNYGGQAFDPGFPSGLNCPHIERCSVSLGTPLYSAVLSCAPLWNSKHPLLKSELWPAHAPVQDGGGRGRNREGGYVRVLSVCVCMRALAVRPIHYVMSHLTERELVFAGVWCSKAGHKGPGVYGHV